MVVKLTRTSTPSDLSPQQVVEDYRIAFRSREASVIGRSEVLGGRGKFGAFGDGKELPLVAMAHSSRKVISAAAITVTKP